MLFIAGGSQPLIQNRATAVAPSRVICRKPGTTVVIVVLCFLSADRCAKRDAEREKNARAGERDAEPFSLAYAISPGGRSVGPSTVSVLCTRLGFLRRPLSAVCLCAALFGRRRAMLRRSESIWAINFPSSPAFLRFHCWQSECAECSAASVPRVSAASAAGDLLANMPLSI
jgi:hypothetical protein